MEIGRSDFTPTRRQAWVALLLLSATLAAAAWFGTVHQAASEQHAYDRCTTTTGGCSHPDGSPASAFAVIAIALMLLALCVALRHRRRTSV